MRRPAGAGAPVGVLPGILFGGQSGFRPAADLGWRSGPWPSSPRRSPRSTPEPTGTTGGRWNGCCQELSAEVPGAALDVRLAAIGLSGLLDGLWLEWCLNPATFSPEEGMRLCDDFLDGLLAHGRPREGCT
ncbi:MAG: TetR family transcriptional regulator C-terminal domain-containing protein [Rhodovibrio sp.]|nr:TetR family transcriptional regulator C-terminal domain-containing protein [Rhodovibrio sp.]